MYKINGNPQQFPDLDVFHKLSQQFLPYAQKRLGFDKPVGINLISDPQNAKNPLGKTAYYDPNQLEVTVFVDKRHVKDILRSMSHELVHHTQNCRGEFDGGVQTGPGYAQEDGHMRKMEKEAYLEGQMLLRDFEDNLKNSNLKENQAMGIKRNKSKNIKEGVAKHYVKTSPEGARKTTFMGLSPEAAKIPDKELDKLKLKRKNPQKVSLPPKKKLELSEEDKPDYPDIDKDGDREESMKQAAADKKKKENAVDEAHCPSGKRDDEETLDEDIFAPNHYCVHHGGVQMEGKVKLGTVIGHNWSNKLGRVTKYDMQFADGTIVEGVRAEDILVTEASLANEHAGHSAKRDDDRRKQMKALHKKDKQTDKAKPEMDEVLEEPGKLVVGDDPTEKGAEGEKKKKDKEKKDKEKKDQDVTMENWTRKNKDQLLFERLTKMWTK